MTGMELMKPFALQIIHGTPLGLSRVGCESTAVGVNVTVAVVIFAVAVLLVNKKGSCETASAWLSSWLILPTLLDMLLPTEVVIIEFLEMSVMVKLQRSQPAKIPNTVRTRHWSCDKSLVLVDGVPPILSWLHCQSFPRQPVLGG